MNETEIIRLVTQAVRDADAEFESVGGSTRHWVRECFLPALERVGLTIAPSNNAVHLTPAAGGSCATDDDLPQAQVTADC